MTNLMQPAPKEAALTGLPVGERRFLDALFEFTRSAQLNPDPGIVAAAKRWDRALRFRAAVFSQHAGRRINPAPQG